MKSLSAFAADCKTGILGAVCANCLETGTLCIAKNGDGECDNAKRCGSGKFVVIV